MPDTLRLYKLVCIAAWAPSDSDYRGPLLAFLQIRLMLHGAPPRIPHQRFLLPVVPFDSTARRSAEIRIWAHRGLFPLLCGVPATLASAMRQTFLSGAYRALCIMSTPSLSPSRKTHYAVHSTVRLTVRTLRRRSRIPRRGRASRSQAHRRACPSGRAQRFRPSARARAA